MAKRIRAGPITVYLVKIGARRGKRKPKYPYALKWRGPNGEWKQKNVRTRNRREAEQAREWWQSELNGWNPPTPDPIPFEQFKNAYLDAAKAADLARATVGSAKWTLERFSRYMRPQMLGDVDTRMASAYMARRRNEDGVAPASVAKDYRTLHAAFNWAVENGYLAANPFARVKPPKVTRKENIVLTETQCRRLLEECERRGTLLHAFVALAVETGMRISEMANLEPADIDFQARLVSIRPKEDWSPKARRGRVVAVTEETAGLLFELRGRGPYILAGTSRDQWKRMMRAKLKEACRKAGVPVVTPHDLRRTAATLMALAGVPQDVAQAVLGHASYQTTRQFYIRVNAEEAARRALDIRRRRT